MHVRGEEEVLVPEREEANCREVARRSIAVRWCEA
jgi:hypothetical protein